LYFSADIVRMIETWSMGEGMFLMWQGREIYNTTMLSPQNLKEGDHFDSVGIGERITLQWILKK